MYVQKLPFIFGSLAAIIVGLISFDGGVAGREIYLKMAVSMILFYLLGMLLRRMIETTNKELEEKKRLEAKRLLEEQELAAQKLADGQQSEPQIDYKIDDDEFQPFKVSEYINTKENQ